DEKDRAERANDPLERYKAKRRAELLDLRALLNRDESALAASPDLSETQQRELANRAEADFLGLKQLVEEGHASALVALRLKNDSRRLSYERDAVARNELARASNELTRWENALTAVELDLVSDAHDDRFLLDALLETLPASRRAEALAMSEALEAE